MLPSPRADCAHIWGQLYIFGGSPTCGLSGNDTAACHNSALATTYQYFDVMYPRLYIFYKQDANPSTFFGPA